MTTRHDWPYTCHWPDCGRPVHPSMWACPQHRHLLPGGRLIPIEDWGLTAIPPAAFDVDEEFARRLLARYMPADDGA